MAKAYFEKKKKTKKKMKKKKKKQKTKWLVIKAYWNAYNNAGIYMYQHSYLLLTANITKTSKVWNYKKLTNADDVMLCWRGNTLILN